MPSLRRSLSFPSVRPAPYPALLSATSAAGPRTHGSGHRRSTGSETSNRRVLADIEWWRVAGGQSAEQGPEEPDLGPDQEDDVAPGQVQEVPVPSAGPASEVGVERPLTSAHWSSFAPGSLEMPVDQMAALSIAPATPGRHALESSTSSLESTPEAPGVQAELPHLDLAALNFGLPESDVPVIGHARNGTPPSPLSIRSHSFADFASHERQYADFAISPLSSPPIFSN
ncbi:hypothetical protein B0H10DRAFT_2207676 [Mycena sp. CBHHK59/15]|nr:hypothetical protein B0H10DRAFT_2207676 [Mycena sp. CBHHK59/15]